MEFRVRVVNGEVYINDTLISQCCWDCESVGYAIACWLSGNI